MSEKIISKDRPPSKRSWRRWFVRILICVCLSIVLIPFAFLVRLWYLSYVPDIPVPFDVESFCHVDIPPGQNSFDHYVEAYRMNKEVSFDLNGEGEAVIQARSGELYLSGKTALTPELIHWAEKYREVLEEWRKGTRCTDAQYVPICDRDLNTPFPVSTSLRWMANLAQVEALRFEVEGKLEEAGATWIAILRSSRHVGRSTSAVERMNGAAIHTIAARGLNRWASHPALTTQQLALVHRQVLEADLKTSPLSSVLQAEYVQLDNSMKDLEKPLDDDRKNRSKQFSLWLIGEPQNFRKLLKQILANQLNEIDKPFADRAPEAGTGTVVLFQPDPNTPLERGRLNPDQIDQAIEYSLISKHLLSDVNLLQKGIMRERARQATLELSLLMHRYYREQGEFPESADVIGQLYQESLPLDPYDRDGKPIRYRRDDQQNAVVWSVGENGEDDGGQVQETPSGSYLDVGWELNLQDTQTRE